jgi:hypothetical protein
MKRFATVAGLLSVALLAPAAAAQSKAWLHVQVEEAKGSKVHVNVPLSLAEIALKSAPKAIVDDHHIRFGRHNEFKVSDMRRLWAELKAAGDTDFVTVQDESDGGTVKVSRKGDLVQVRVTGDRRDGNVTVDVPVSLVDALFAGDGDEVDVQGALRELSKRRGDIVRIEGGNDNVRVWIDEGN